MLHTLTNDFWQVGILPGTGASIAFGRVRRGDAWVDVLRPTAESDYGSSSNCSSFIMLPWCNRIKDGILRFNDAEYPLRTTTDDGTARHGDVRGRSWKIEAADEQHIQMSFNSSAYHDVNWPFRFSALAEYHLDGADFVWTLTLKNEDERPMPAGFGHHPYFVRGAGVSVQIPCAAQFDLVDYMAVAPPVPLSPRLDFRQLRAVDDSERNDLLTHRLGDAPARIVYPAAGIELDMHADSVFRHILLFAPAAKPFIAVEPMTNASDGFNLHQQGIPDSGVFILQPGEQQTGVIRLHTN